MLAVIQTPMDHCHQTTKFTFCQYYYCNTASIGSKKKKKFLTANIPGYMVLREVS